MANTQLSPIKEIDGMKFQVDMLDLDTACEVFAYAVQFMGPALLNVVAKAAGGKSLGDVDSTVALGEVSKALEGLTPDKLKYFRDAFATCSRLEFNGKWTPLKPMMATVLRGRVGTMLKWMGFAFQVNFNDFLGDALTTLRRPATPQSPEASASESPAE